MYIKLCACVPLRFSGEEVLPCNCGAVSCRRTVNYNSDDEGDHLLAPRHQLRRFKPSLLETLSP